MIKKIQKMLKKSAYGIGILSAGVLLGLTLQFAKAAWTDAPANPPSANVGAPINTGSVAQTRTGKLILNGGLDMSAGTTLHNFGRMHISGEEYLYLLNKSGVFISKAWGGNGNLQVEGSIGIGTNPEVKLDVIGETRVRNAGNNDIRLGYSGYYGNWGMISSTPVYGYNFYVGQVGKWVTELGGGEINRFGGMYVDMGEYCEKVGWNACVSPNPFTGACNCPAGYSKQKIITLPVVGAMSDEVCQTRSRGIYACYK